MRLEKTSKMSPTINPSPMATAHAGSLLSFQKQLYVYMYIYIHIAEIAPKHFHQWLEDLPTHSWFHMGQMGNAQMSPFPLR